MFCECSVLQSENMEAVAFLIAVDNRTVTDLMSQKDDKGKTPQEVRLFGMWIFSELLEKLKAAESICFRAYWQS